MTTTYVPLKYAKKAMREVREESLREGERRGYARATEFVRMASSLNGSTHAVLKALQEEGDGLATPRNRMVPVDGDGAAVDGAPDGDLDAVLMAALDALAEAKTHHPETDGGPVYAYLAGLLADPEALADALAEMDGGEVVGKSFDESKHPRGDNGRFIGREQIHAAKSDPKLANELRAKTTDPEQRKKLEAALKGDVDLGRTKAGEHRERVAKQRQDRQERVKRAQELANEISMWRRGGEAVPASHFRELAEVLPSMTVAELRSVRGKLAASFGGDRRKAEMAARLLEHAKNKAALLETNEKYDDMDALDFGSLHEYQNEGNAKGNEARNPNPEEQHGGRMQQRHDLMGAGAKGELNAPGKLSHGTPDTGSVLKLGDKPAPPQEPLSEPRQPAPSPAPSGEGATVAAHTTKPAYTTDKPEGGATVKQPSEEAKKRLDALLAPGNDVDKAREAATLAENSFEFGHRVRHYVNGTFDVATAGHGGTLSEREKATKVIAGPFQTEEEARRAFVEARSAAKKPHLDKMRAFEAEREALLKAEADAEDAARPPITFGKPATQTDAVPRKDIAADEKHNQPHNSDEAGAVNASPSEEHVADIARARDADKKFRGEGRYEAEVWQKLRNSNPDKPMPPLSRDAAEWLADGYERDGKPIPDEVLKDNPDLRGQYQKQPHEMTRAGLSATRRNHEPTGVKKGQLTKLPLNKLTFPIKWSSEVMPLKDNANEPLIVKKVGDKYQVIDGYGRTSGLRNAGATFAHAIVVSDSDLNQNQHGQGDDPQWVAEMHHKYAPKSAMAISPHEWRRREANQQQALKDAADRKAQEEIAERKRKEEYSRTPIDNMDVDQLKVALEPFGHISNFFGMREYDQLQSGNKEAVEKLRQIVRDKTAGGTLAAGKPVPPASDTPLSPAVHNAVKDAVKHHKRMQMPGKPVPQMVVYHIPEHRNTGGQLIEPAKVNAVPVNSYTGEQLLSGKLPHLKIEGTFEVGADGVPKKVEGGQAANFPSSQFSPEQAIKVAADDVSKLRKPDVFRAVEWAPTEHRAAVVDHIAKNRPDLHEELNAVADELGISSKPQMASTFSDADFENGNMHEKKVGNARLQYGVNENTGRAELYSLRVPQKDRGKGSAKQAMKEFLSEADRRGLPVELLASPLDKRTNLGKLVRFYESLGFKVVGRGNPAGDPKMIREPNGDTQRKAVSTDWDDLRAELKVKRGIVHDDGATA